MYYGPIIPITYRGMSVLSYMLRFFKNVPKLLSQIVLSKPSRENAALRFSNILQRLDILFRILQIFRKNNIQKISYRKRDNTLSKIKDGFGQHRKGTSPLTFTIKKFEILKLKILKKYMKWLKNN